MCYTATAHAAQPSTRGWLPQAYTPYYEQLHRSLTFYSAARDHTGDEISNATARRLTKNVETEDFLADKVPQVGELEGGYLPHLGDVPTRTALSKKPRSGWLQAKGVREKTGIHHHDCDY